jgi:hypothetical protein
MASNNLPATKPEKEESPVVYQPPASFVVLDETGADVVTFDHHGQSVVGIFRGSEEMVDDDGEKFDMASFTAPDGKPFVIFPGKGLRRIIYKLSIGEWARITYRGDIDTGKPSPMKAFTVEVAKP